MRHAKAVALILLAVSMTIASVQAQPEHWPGRTVKIVLPLPVGGGTDLAARLFAERLSQRWRQPVVVENRPGVDGIVGVTSFVNSHDDHTLLFSFAGPISINPFVHETLPYDPARDLVPIAPAIDNFFGIAVSKSLGAQSLDSFIEMARGHPGKFNWAATAGLPRYIFLALQKKTDLAMTEVPYRDVALALQDLAEDRIQVLVTTPSVMLALIESGDAKLLMVTNRERSPLAPTVPTAEEAGYPELTFDGIVGFYGWRDMPAALRDRIAKDVGAVAKEPEINSRLRSVGVAVRSGTPAQFSAAIDEQREKVRAIVPAAKV